MRKILIEYKKEQLLLSFPPNKEEAFERVLKVAIDDCKRANDKKGLIEHITQCMYRNGFHVLNLKDVEVKKVKI